MTERYIRIGKLHLANATDKKRFFGRVLRNTLLLLLVVFRVASRSDSLQHVAVQ